MGERGHRYVVVIPLEPMAVGDRFATSRWPLHVTIVQPFRSTASAAAVGESLAAAAAKEKPVAVTAGPDEGFGPSHNIPVTTIESSAELAELHEKLVADFEIFSPTYESPEYMGAWFRAHVTVKKHARVHPGQRLLLSQVALVDMEPDQPGGGRGVLSVTTLGEK